jgi:hypothetical protein
VPITHVLLRRYGIVPTKLLRVIDIISITYTRGHTEIALFRLDTTHVNPWFDLANHVRTLSALALFYKFRSSGTLELKRTERTTINVIVSTSYILISIYINYINSPKYY